MLMIMIMIIMISMMMVFNMTFFLSILCVKMLHTRSGISSYSALKSETNILPIVQTILEIRFSVPFKTPSIYGLKSIHLLLRRHAQTFEIWEQKRMGQEFHVLTALKYASLLAYFKVCIVMLVKLIFKAVFMVLEICQFLLKTSKSVTTQFTFRNSGTREDNTSVWCFKWSNSYPFDDM